MENPYDSHNCKAENELMKASMNLLRQLDVAKVLDNMLDFIMEIGQTPHVSLHLFADERALLLTGRGLHEKLVGKSRAIAKGEMGEMLRIGKTWINMDYRNKRADNLPLPSDLVFAKAHEHVQASLTIPFKKGDVIIGAIGLDYGQTEAFPANDRLVILEQYASWAGIAYENACRFNEKLQYMGNSEVAMKQMEQSNAMMLFLFETSLAILQRLDIKELLEIIITKGAEYTKADGAYVFLPTGDSDELERSIAIGAARESLGLRIRRGEGAAGKAWENDEMVVNNTYKASQGHLASCSNVEAIINFPLRRDNQVVGVVGFWHIHFGEKFWENDVQAIRYLAQLSSLAYDNACLYDDAKKEISNRKQLEDEIRHMAYHDALTGLPNRRLLEDRLTLAISQARRFDEKLAVMFLDLDSMKMVNDTFGHETGDNLLESVAVRLRNAVRDIDTVARISGDEFVLVLPRQESRKMTGELADRVLAAIRQPFDFGRSPQVRVTASIGIGFFPEDGKDYATLLRSADKAMYLAKQQGRDRWVFSSGTAVLS